MLVPFCLLNDASLKLDDAAFLSLSSVSAQTDQWLRSNNSAVFGGRLVLTHYLQLRVNFWLFTVKIQKENINNRVLWESFLPRISMLLHGLDKCVAVRSSFSSVHLFPWQDVQYCVRPSAGSIYGTRSGQWRLFRLPLCIRSAAPTQSFWLTLKQVEPQWNT